MPDSSQTPPGVVVDRSPDPSSVFLGCPSIAILPGGDLVATHSWFGPGTSMSSSVVFRSGDGGETWAQIGELTGQWWSTLFVHRGTLYTMGVGNRYGQVVIRRSLDGGAKWTDPQDEHSGLLVAAGENHTAPVPVVAHEGRLWRAYERREPAAGWAWNFWPFVMSAPEDADLLDAASWDVGEMYPRFDPEWAADLVSAAHRAKSRAHEHPNFVTKPGWLEGNIVVTPAGDLVDILRVHEPLAGRNAAMIHIDAATGALSFEPDRDFLDFPGGCVKFTIRFDPVSQHYWSLVNAVHEDDLYHNAERTRNTLALSCSPDLREWRVVREIIHHPDRDNTGFQYVDWQFSGEDILAVSRTAFGGADNSHNANYFTYHRINDFRASLTEVCHG